MRDVVEEGVAGAASVAPPGSAVRSRPPAVALDQTQVGHELREAVRAGDEVAIGIGREQRNVEDVRVGQLDAEQMAACALISAQLDAAVGRRRSTGRWRPFGRVRRGVLAQEHLMRGVRGVGLVLVDERRRLVVMARGRHRRCRGCRRRSLAVLVARVSTMKRWLTGRSSCPRYVAR